MKTITKLWIFITALAALAPMGLILPDLFKAGAAWGEWSPDEVKNLVGYIPQGLERMASLWNAPIPDYAFKGWADRTLPAMSISYIISAIAGVLITIVAVLLIGKGLSKKE